jgi:glycosyltransferase involved in cell wall biosynthesis
LGREAFGEIPIPTLGTANSMRIEAVEDEADAHEVTKVYRALSRLREEASTLLTLVRALVESSAPQDERIVTVRRLAIVPALNEAQTIGRVIEEIRSFDPGFEILVVDDGSTDGTWSEAVRAGALVVRLPYNIGIGAAVQTGYQYARNHGFQIAVQIDGDGQHDPSELGRLLEPLAADSADMVVGSRFREGGLYRAPFMRRLGIRLLAGVVTVVIRQRMTDPTSGFRGVNRRGIILFAADYPHDYPEAEANVLAFRHRLRIVEVPVSMRSRSAGRSSITALGSLYYMIKVSLALFISVFRRYRVLEER